MREQKIEQVASKAKATNIIEFPGAHLPRSSPKPKRARTQKGDFYSRYPLPFFSAGNNSVWAVSETGDRVADWDTGHQFGTAFVRSCDGSAGWQHLLGMIVNEMIREGDTNQIVMGFMTAISVRLAAFRPHS